MDVGSPKVSVNSDLDQLAAKIRGAVQGVQIGTRNALRAAFDAGDALIQAHEKVTEGRWTRWLTDNCFLSKRTADLYQQLARHRDEIEAKIERSGELSLRAAVRLISTPCKKKPRLKPKLAILVAWLVASPAERTAALDKIDPSALYAALPDRLRNDLVRRAKGVHLDGEGGDPFLKASEILRRAISLNKTADSPGVSPPVAASNDKEALAALRQLSIVLAHAGIDEVTIVQRHAKACRRAA